MLAPPRAGRPATPLKLLLENAPAVLLAPVLQVSGTPLLNAISVLPGFTPSDSWTATWQGVLPGLSVRSGETGPVGDGRPWLALQVRIADASGLPHDHYVHVGCVVMAD